MTTDLNKKGEKLPFYSLDKEKCKLCGFKEKHFVLVKVYL